MKILVTGGCGFVGSNLVDLLVQDSENEVMVIDNLDTGKKQYCNEKIKAASCSCKKNRGSCGCKKKGSCSCHVAPRIVAG